MLIRRILLLIISLFLITPAFANQPKETNITGRGFTISWITDTHGTSAVAYGLGTNSINLLATDNRVSTTHHVEVNGLSPITTYYYDIISGGITDNNHGQHYSLTTGPDIGIPTGTNTFVYGQVYKADGSATQGSLVYLVICNTNGKGSSGTSSEWSTVVGNDGNWSINLANVRTQNLSSFFDYSTSGDSLSIFVQAGIDGTGKLFTDTANGSPCRSITISTDTTPPTAVSNLTLGTIGQTSVALEWSSSGDDGDTGTADGYQVCHSIYPITESNWLGVPVSKSAGTKQQCTVSNLIPGTGYYFAIKACDEVPNWSGISNIVAATTLVPSTSTLKWLNRPNLVTDGLRTEIGTSGMNIVYQVLYKDADGKPLAIGYPRVGIYRDGGSLVATYTMLYASGSPSVGAVYTFSKQFDQLGTGTYAYQFDGGNVMGTAASGGHLCMRNGPIILESLPDHATNDLSTLTTGSRLIYGQIYQQGGTQSASGATVYGRLHDKDGYRISEFLTIGSATVDTDGTWFMEMANFRDLERPPWRQGTDSLHIWIGATNGVASQILMTEDTPVCDLELCNDHIPPATVSLTAKTAGPNSIDLTWPTAGDVRDDGTIGQASWYHIRYSTSTSTDKILDHGIQVCLPAANSVRITGLAPETKYYFIIQASDDVWNTSAPSQIVIGTTAPPLQRPPILSWSNKPLTPGTANVYTRFTYNVRYTDADGDQPLPGEPRVVICQGGKEIKTCPMSQIGGGATYTCSTLLPEAGTYSYRFEVTGATSSLTGNGPLVFDIPKHLRITNVTDKEFTVSWRTGDKGRGSVSYGTTTALGSTAADVVSRDVHYVTVENLKPDTVYCFDVTGSGITDDNQGRHFLVKTGASMINTSPGSNFVTGYVYEYRNIPAQGAVVYVTIKDTDGQGSTEESAPLSVLTNADGGWFVDAFNVRTRDYLSRFEYSGDDTIYIEADGGERGQGNRLITPNDPPTDIILHTWIGTRDKLLVKDMTYSYPNPAKKVNVITFRYYLNADADVTLSIYNLAGELVQTIKGRGVGYNDTNEFVWNIADIASDIYIWRLEAVSGELQDVVVKRLVVIK
ncbi:MAG: fibronectin type III domain-containing protein [bacterium]